MRTKEDILHGMTDQHGNKLRETSHEKALIEVLIDIRDLKINLP